MRIAVMTSGGDAAGMNPAVWCFVDYCRRLGHEPWLVFEGLRGLIDDQLEPATPDHIEGILNRGGTVLRTSRSKRFRELQHRREAYENLRRRGIEGLVVIGGDGSFTALRQFHHDFQVPFVGIPATIDNDIPGTNYCLGVDTALNVIRTAIDSLADTASSLKRAFVIETMGRDCGYLALVSAITSGAEICLAKELLPEGSTTYDFERLRPRMEKRIRERRLHIMAIVAEGTGRSNDLRYWLETQIGIETRVSVLGHIQRGGSPTVYDRLMAFKFTFAAVDTLLAGGANVAIVHRDGQFLPCPIDAIVGQEYQLPKDLLRVGRALFG